MSHAVWRFERSVSETVEMLRDIIQRDDRVKASGIRGEWAYRAQVLLEPAGWDALWRLSREACQKFGVRFPCVVYVTVENLELDVGETEDLYAVVEVVGVQDDSVHLPARHPAVSLSQLWPVTAQPNTAIDIRPTAEFIDLYRHFYTLIWMPWDMDSDEEFDWFERNVPARCRLWADALAGRSSGGAGAFQLRALRQEADMLARRIAQVEDGLPSDTEEDDLDCSGEQVSELMMLHNRLQNVRSRWEALQNPTIRGITMEEDLPPKNIVVWTGGSINSHISCLNFASEWLRTIDEGTGVETDNVHCAPSLEAALHSLPPRGSRIILCPGEHKLPSDNTVGRNYTIKSVTQDGTLMCEEERTTSLAVSGLVSLEGLEMAAGSSSTALSVRSGRASLTLCRFPRPQMTPLASIRSPTEVHHAQAVVVSSGAELVMRSCGVDGYFTGIVAHSGASVCLEDCVMSDCGVALQVYAGAKVSLIRCAFKGCTEAAIRYETTSVKASSAGGTNLLNEYGDITMADCKFSTIADCFTDSAPEVCLVRLDENACPEWEGD